MELHKALGQISEIRHQMSRSELFRGYRSLTIACSGLLALIAAACQPLLITSPETQVDRYLMLWITVAGISVLMAGGEMYWRLSRSRQVVQRQKSLVAVEQFLPCIVIGALLTLIIYHTAPQVAWMLPGLWALCFSLGIFASSRILPRQSGWSGAYYVLCGAGCLIWGQGENYLSPWLMAISFGGGQLVCAVVIYWTLERRDVS